MHDITFWNIFESTMKSHCSTACFVCHWAFINYCIPQYSQWKNNPIFLTNHLAFRWWRHHRQELTKYDNVPHSPFSLLFQNQTPFPHLKQPEEISPTPFPPAYLQALSITHRAPSLCPYRTLSLTPTLPYCPRNYPTPSAFVFFPTFLALSVSPSSIYLCVWVVFSTPFSLSFCVHPLFPFHLILTPSLLNSISPYNFHFSIIFIISFLSHPSHLSLNLCLPLCLCLSSPLSPF